MTEKPKLSETFFNMVKTPTRNHSSVVGHPDIMCEALWLILRVPTRHKAPVTVTPVKGKCFPSQVRKAAAVPFVPSSNTELEATATKIHRQTGAEEMAQWEGTLPV